jgi:adenosylhomocysteinase
MIISEQINFKPFLKARETQKIQDIPFLSELRSFMKTNKPYQGLRILHNTPLSIETVCKLETLALSGAELTITGSISVHPSTRPLAIKLLRDTGIHLELDHQKLKNQTYDFCLDVCAELYNLINVKLGYVELTQSGEQWLQQQKLNIPVLSINDSIIKKLETFYGTGEGFLRALRKLINSDLRMLKVLQFGFGKVGQGVAHFLQPHVSNITIVDISPQSLNLSRSKGLKSIDARNTNKVLNELKEASLIITATGIHGFVSKNYPRNLFDGKILANIGALDEFGELFLENEVLFNKQPINFSLQTPTLMRYLDPIFYAHTLGPNIILQYDLQPGYHSLPKKVDQEILNLWSHMHQEDLSHILNN